jgi:hypothetical protein
VSYSREDGTPFVRELEERLARMPVRVRGWIDHHVPPGSGFAKEIKRRLLECQVVLFVMTPGSAESEWCDRELLLADEVKKPIIPLTFHPGVDRPLVLQNLVAVALIGEGREAGWADLTQRLTQLASSGQRPAALMPQRENRPSGVRLTRRLVLAVSAGVAVAAVVAAALHAAGNAPVPSLSQQVNEIRSALVEEDFQVWVRSAQLQPDAGPSTVLVAKPKDTKRESDPDAHDRLLIYDQDSSGILKQTFAFEPVAERLSDAGPLPGSARPERFTFPLDPEEKGVQDGLDYRDYLQVTNVDTADGAEILGAVAELGNEQDVYPRPFVIAWDMKHRHYVLQALLTPKSTGLDDMTGELEKPTGGRLDYATLLYNNVYLRPTLIRNAATGHVLEAFAPQAYALQQLPVDRSSQGYAGKLRLRAAYAVAGDTAGTLSKIQVIDWILVMRPNGDEVTAYPAPLRDVDVGVNSSRIPEVLQQLQ